jgi:hypothetical protein
MPKHWTYSSFNQEEDLEQGDILKPSAELRALLNEVHHHFLDDKYVGFLIATQSCDLVLRKGSAKAPYINLAVIRPLNNVAHKLIAQVSTPIKPRVFPKSEKGKAKDLLVRIFNQNEQAIGVFFLHEDADSGIAEPCVVMLRVTVAVRSEHYAMLQKARVGRLNVEFRAKLGWLLGNLYARPATRDWGEIEGGKRQLDSLVSDYLDEQTSDESLTWLDDELIREAIERKIDLKEVSFQELEQYRPKSRHEQSLDQIRQELLRVAPEIDAEKVDKLTNRLRNNGKFKKLFLNPDSSLGSIE